MEKIVLKHGIFTESGDNRDKMMERKRERAAHCILKLSKILRFSLKNYLAAGERKAEKIHFACGNGVAGEIQYLQLDEG